MKYTKGRLNRVFVLKFDNGDDFLEEIKGFSLKENIKAGSFVFLGALKKGNLVTGPKKPVIPPEPNKVKFDNAWEVFGIGTIFANKQGPQVHIHSSLGKKNKALTGCIRDNSKVFLVIEAVVFEIEGVNASKDIDPETGLNLLRVF